ncbi:MAG: hypothetical protein ACRDRW_17065 [Pseudonocardiaceae bacterium]
MASRAMDCSGLGLAAVFALWGAVALLLAVFVIGETLDWWHRRRQRGAHHPTGPAARTVAEITQRLHRDSTRLPPPRVIVIRRRMTDASTTAPRTAGSPVGDGGHAATVPDTSSNHSHHRPAE